MNVFARDNPDAPVIVTGCAAQIDADMFAEMPEDLQLQMRTRRTSSIGEDPSQIASPEVANG